MGRPTTEKNPTGGHRREPNSYDGASTSSAMSSNSTINHPDNQEESETDNEPLLPPYTDEPDSSPTPPNFPDSRSYDQAPLMQDPRIEERTTLDHKGTRLIRLSPVLTTDPIALKAYLLDQAKQELQSYILVTGSHETTNRTSDNKSKKETVTDFSFQIDVSETVNRRRSGRNGDGCWSSLEIVGNDRKTYRAGIMKSRDGRTGADDLERLARPTQSLEEWCHLFCASNSALKTFTLRRRITNRDEKALRDGIETIIRSHARYRGRIDISFPTHIRTVSITTPHWINRLRTNTFVYWTCIILQLWLLTWPALILMTKRWDVVEVLFPFKRGGGGGGSGGVVEYVAESEVDWCRKWRYSIVEACKGRLGQAGNLPSRRRTVELRYVDEMADQVAKARTAGDGEARVSQTGGLGSAMGFGRGGFAVAGTWRDGQDWGFDD